MTDPRAEILHALRQLANGAATDALAPDCLWQVSSPLAPMTGPAAVREGFFAPLRAAFTGLHRRDEIFIGGPNRRDAGGIWCASVGHYVGNFTGRLWGIAPSGHLAFLRAGEFYRIEGGRILQAYIILDLPDLMRQAGRMPFPFSLGLETMFPGPATHDGVLPLPGGGSASLDLVERMFSTLGAFDPQTFASEGQTGEGGTWADDMFWYGVCGIGSNYRWDGFVKDHRAPFLRAFPDRQGGNHYARICDGAYVAVGGWPSMTMTFRGDYLGVPADGRPLTLRVMDFYRCAGGRIAENWVFLDYVDLFAQMGVDLIGQAQAPRPQPGEAIGPGLDAARPVDAEGRRS
jgi:predicted ester cyclase